MNQQPSNNNPSRRTHDFNMEHFRIRLTARLCIILVCLVQYIPRIPTIVADPGSLSNVKLFAILSLPFPILMILTIMLEYFLYKKLGPGIVKYSWLVDIMLLIFFIADWITVVISYVNRIQETNPTSFSVGALYGFTTFSWRTLMVTLIVQKWQLKIIAPVVAICVATGYAIHYTTGTILYLMLAAGTQLFNVIIIIYCEDKVKWRMVWANIQQEKWMQVNNFILNSIPENIMILDLAGETKFISEYCKAFIKKCHLPLENIKEFFKKVRDLQQQYEPDPQSPSASLIHIERLTTVNGLLGDTENNNTNISRNDLLEDLISNFKNIILNKEIQERQFLIYNAKLKMDNHKDKSLEIKISFVQHFENYHIVLIIRDTTQRDLLITLEETNKYKDQLLASVSHELRAPLNGNINLVESAVQSKRIPENVKENLLIPALRSSKFLLHIINDILDMSQIKEKKLRLVFNSENLKETLKSTSLLVELQAKKKGIELVLDLDPSLPRRFCTDHIRLSQIVLNLLNNAIKFTREGQVKLTAKTMFEAPSWVKITIEDSGIGMSQENVQKLFSSYTHIEFEGRQVMNPTGVGLGLNIAYNLADLLAPKGQQGINVASIPNQGSSFTFILENKEKIELEDLKDLERSRSGSCEVAEELPGSIHPMFLTKPDSANSIAPIAENSQDFSKKDSCSCAKVLIVDDNPFNTMAFETILGSLEVKCDSVYSGSACIKSLLSRETRICGDNCHQYAVIFMDQEMPEMSGVDTVNEITMLQGQKRLSPNIKVIGCTAHKSKEEVDKFLDTGIVQCIHKPISAVMIKDILKKVLTEI